MRDDGESGSAAARPAAAAGIGRSSTAPGTPWTAWLKALDEALTRGEVEAAVRAWHEAHLAAVASLRWEALIEIGDAHLRIGRALGPVDAGLGNARRAYFAALFRACRMDAVEGILRAAEAFAALGDHQVVEECIGAAALLAAEDGEARDQVARVTGRLAPPAAGARGPGPPDSPG